jgi:hypothetical protein
MDMRPPIRFALAALLAATPLAAQAPAAQAPAATAAKAPAPRIYFRAPRNNAVVDTTFDVAFGLRNYGVAPAGVNLANTGHFHVLIDVMPPAPGTVIPADSLHRHFGGGQIETTLTLRPGRHVLRLVLADFEHKVIGPQLVSAPITVIVR